MDTEGPRRWDGTQEMQGPGSQGKDLYQGGGGTQLYCKLLRSHVQWGLRSGPWIWQRGAFLVTFMNEGGFTDVMGDESLGDGG